MEKQSKRPYPPYLFSCEEPWRVFGMVLVLGLAVVFVLGCMLFCTKINILSLLFFYQAE